VMANSSIVSGGSDPVRVALRKDSDRRVRAGHLWIFSNELRDGFQQIPPGEIVEVFDHGGRFVGVGTVNPHSLITVRLLSRERITVDAAFIQARIEAALALRSRLPGFSENGRIIFSEADLLPGLIVDRFGDLLVLQTSTAGMDRLLPLIVQSLVKLLAPSAIIAANDMGSRELEGLPQSREIIYGSFEGMKSFVQDGIHFIADPLHGQKTGFFFDQRFNRQLFASAIQPGAQVLDLFCYTGGFGLYALAAGAKHVTFVDASESALAITRDAVIRNGWPERAKFIKADIFPFLKDHTGHYDAVSVDPPALAKNRTKVPAALRAYSDLNARALDCVSPNGVLATSSCSGLVQYPNWRETIREAANKSGRPVRLILHGAQAPDHPILAAMPETEYLKFLIGVA
jgi:23S rRNA (cytosine1962-C5)-methyltransferase